MQRKLYNTLNRTGSGAITLGVITMIVGLVVGILSIVIGGKLLKAKTKILL